MVVVNLSEPMARTLLAVVDAEAEKLLELLKSQMPPHARALTTVRLQHLGVVKHRLEVNLWLPDPFPGPHAWGHPRRPAPEGDDGPVTGDLFARRRKP